MPHSHDDQTVDNLDMRIEELEEELAAERQARQAAEDIAAGVRLSLRACQDREEQAEARVAELERRLELAGSQEDMNDAYQCGTVGEVAWKARAEQAEARLREARDFISDLIQEGSKARNAARAFLAEFYE